MENSIFNPIINPINLNENGNKNEINDFNGRSNAENGLAERAASGGQQSFTGEGGDTDRKDEGTEVSRPEEQRKNARASETEHNDAGILSSEEKLEIDRIIMLSISGYLENSDIESYVSIFTYKDENNEIHLRSEALLHEYQEETINIVSKYKNGGKLKSGRGILDEYYTEIPLVEKIGELIKSHFSKATSPLKVLEPSVGTGNFLNALTPISPSSKITTFEINPTTAGITKLLYPEAEVNLRSFETEFIDERGKKKPVDKKYDLVIGNPPYGEHRGFYKGLGEEPNIVKYEDYFVKRSLDVLNEGGLLAMVLPSGWLSRQKKIVGAEIVNAYRLPSGVFKNTKVGTDIIVLKRKSNALAHNISDYFTNNPNKVLGEIAERSNRFGRMEEYVKGSLQEALEKLDQDLELNELKTNPELNTDAIDLFNYMDYEIEPPIFQPSSEQQEVAEFYKPEKQNSDFISNEEEEIESKTNETFSDYTIQSQINLKKGILKYLFKKDDQIVETALQNSTDLSREQIEAFRDTEYDGLFNNPKKHLKFANYYNGVWVHDFYYAEGNIYQKLEQLESDFSETKDNPNSKQQYEKQRNLLESVLPEKKTLEEIIINPNHEFVHKFSLGKEEKDVSVVTGYDFRGMPNYSSEKQMVDVSLADKFISFVYGLPKDSFGTSSSWEVVSYVKNESVTGSDKERNALVRERRKEVGNDLFKKFLHEELDKEQQDKFVEQFNRNYNNIYVPDYSQFPLFSNIYKNFKGSELVLTSVQKAGIGRLTTKGVGLLAHEVGFGKTLSGILSMHEAMERGNAKRPLIVVPNDNILKQWVETIYETIPNAKVNVLGNLGKDYDLSNFENRDGEITIITYSGFNNIGFSNEVTERLASKFSYISQNELKALKNSVRENQLEEKKSDELKGKMLRGKVYDWEDFGFDHLTFDEVHNANHIVSKVKIEDKRFSSDFRSQNQATSQIGINAWMASQYLQENYNGRNVTLLSATPFTNKPLEYYSILSLIANNRLEQSGYFNVNTFFETFMEAENEMEINAKGDLVNKSNVKRFKNNSLFQQLLSEFIDIKGEEDNPALQRPNRINKEYKVPQNQLTINAYESLNDSFDDSNSGAILTHILNARLIAISPYLAKDYDGAEPTVREFIENSPKLKLTMDLIKENKQTSDAGQIIYSELATSEFPKLKEYLVNEVGYSNDEVAIITGAVTKDKRLDIQQKYNDGKIKIIIGSSAIQEGMNLQTNTSDMYLLSLPYNFTSLRQVEGRAWRQGNKWANVRINFVLTNDSIDVFMLQKLQAKQSRYMESMKKGANIIDVSDVNTDELKTSIITNPDLRADIEIKILENQIKAEQIKYTSDLGFFSRKFEKFTKSDEYINYQKSLETLKRHKEFAETEKDPNGYWHQQIASSEQKLDFAINKLEELEQKLANSGVDVRTFQEQKNLVELKISELDKKLQEDLPVLKSELIAKYRAERELLLNAPEIDYLAERREENKTFYVLRDSSVKEAKIIDENTLDISEIKNIPISVEKENTMANKIKVEIGVYSDTESRNIAPSVYEFDSLTELYSYLDLEMAKYDLDPALLVRIAEGKQPFLLGNGSQYALSQFMKEVQNDLVSKLVPEERKGEAFHIKVSKDEAEYLLINDVVSDIMNKEYGNDDDWVGLTKEDFNEDDIFDEEYQTFEIDVTGETPVNIQALLSELKIYKELSSESNLQEVGDEVEESHIIGGKISDIAEKVVNGDYKDFKQFDKNTQNVILMYIENSDYHNRLEVLSEVWNSELSNPSDLSKGMTTNQIAEKSNNYFLSHTNFQSEVKAKAKDFAPGLALRDKEGNIFVLREKYDEGIWESTEKLIFENEAHHYTIDKTNSIFQNTIQEENNLYERIVTESNLANEKGYETTALDSYNNIIVVAEKLGLRTELKLISASGKDDDITIFIDYFNNKNEKLPIETALSLPDGKAKTFYQAENQNWQETGYFTNEPEWQKDAINNAYKQILNINQNNEIMDTTPIKNSDQEEEKAKTQPVDAKSVGEYFENYVIDPEKNLTHKDIYAFIAQAGKNQLKELLQQSNLQIEMPLNFKKESVLSNIVNPIRQMDSETIKTFKQNLAEYSLHSKKAEHTTTPYQEKKDWNKYYEDVRNKIDTSKPLTHNDLYGFLNTKITNEVKGALLKKYLPESDLNLNGKLSKNLLYAKIVYPLREQNNEAAFKEDLKILYSNMPKTEVVEVKQDTPHPTQGKTQKDFDAYYEKYALNFDSSKSLMHTSVYAYINNANISDKAKIDLLNKTAEQLGRETELITKPEELYHLSKNKILKELVYPLKENQGSMEDEFKFLLQLSFIEAREKTPDYHNKLDALEVDSATTEKVNIDHVNKMLQSTNIDKLSEEFDIQISPLARESVQKLEFINEINKEPNKINDFIEKLESNNKISKTVKI